MALYAVTENMFEPQSTSFDIRVLESHLWEATSILREEGLIHGDTPRAIWEISDQGRQWLAGQQRLRVV